MGWFTALALAVLLAALPPGGSFVDDDGNVHEGAIEGIASVGITRGCNPPSNDRYCPDSTVNREQMAAFLARALDLPAADRDYFTDDAGSIFESGAAIFFVSNNRTGHLIIEDSVLRDNPSDGFGTAGFPGIFYLGSGPIQVSGSTIE